jgi:hypothetical protein
MWPPAAESNVVDTEMIRLVHEAWSAGNISDEDEAAGGIILEQWAASTIADEEFVAP